MSDDSCCGPITILFISIAILTVLYLILKADVLCSIGILLTAILGIVIIYDIFTGAPSTESSVQPSETTRYSETPKGMRKVTDEDMRRLMGISGDEQKKKKTGNDEDAEADEDLAIAYEAVNE